MFSKKKILKKWFTFVFRLFILVLSFKNLFNFKGAFSENFGFLGFKI